MLKRSYESRPMYWEIIHEGRSIHKEGVRILFGQKIADLLFQDIGEASLHIPSDCASELLVTASKDSLTLINRIREHNGLSQVTMPASNPRNMTRHEWVNEITEKCDKPRCRSTLGFHRCGRCGLKACNQHKNKTGCSA